MMAWYVGIFLIISTDDFARAFTSSKLDMPLSFSFAMNLTNISAVHAASSTAL